MSLQRTIRSSQIIYYQGEATTRVYKIVEGLVRAYVIHDNGEEATIAYFGPDDIFPITTAFGIAPVTLFYYETIPETIVSVLSSKEFEEDIKLHAANELDRFARRYVGALLHVSALTQQTASLKLAHALRYLAIRFGEKTAIGNRVKVTLKLTQQDIAKICNLSRETVSIELGRLKQQDIILVKEKYYFIHVAKLNAFINEDPDSNIHLT